MGGKKLEMSREERKLHDRKLAAERQRKMRAQMSEAEKKKTKAMRRKHKKTYLSKPGNLEKQREYERKSHKRSRKAHQAPPSPPPRSASLLDKLWLLIDE